MAKRFAKWLTVICIVCCMAMVFAFTGCKTESARKELTSVTINDAGHLIATYEDESQEDLGLVKGAQGEKGDKGDNGKDGTDGIGIVKAELNADGELEITYSDNITKKVGPVKGKDGADGKDGKGVTSIITAENGEITITYTDGTTGKLGTLKSIKSTEYKDGKLVVTYNDGTKDEVALKGVLDLSVNEAGKLVVTFYDGSTRELGISTGAKCEHTEIASEATVKPASCAEEGIKLVVCKDCGAVLTQSIEKDAEAHGKWEFDRDVKPGDVKMVQLDNGMITYEKADSGATGYVLKTKYAYGKMTNLEYTSGGCIEATCELCQGVIAPGHVEIENWVPVLIEQSVANVCEETHPTYYTCRNCKAVFLYVEESELNKKFTEIDKTKASAKYTGNNFIYVESVPAAGHQYKVTATEKDNTGKYKITLTCQRAGCNKVIKPYATKESQKQATCKEGGSSIYKYTYKNYVKGILTDVTETIELEKVDKTTNHTVGKMADGTLLQIKANETKEFNDVIKPFVDKKIIRWNEGMPADCATHQLAVFECTVCNEPIVFSLSGEHTLGEEKKFDGKCTADSYDYKECINCEYVYKYNIVKAQGHNYIYKANTLNEDKTEFTAICTKCNETVTAEVAKAEPHDAENCKEKYYTTYTSKPIDNGLGKTQVVTFKVVDETRKMLHTFSKDGIVVKVNTVDKYEYTENIDVLFAANVLRWNEGTPATCSDYMFAVGLKCDVCQEPVVFSLSGKHNYGTNPEVEHEGTCTTRSYTTKKCDTCGVDIEQTATDAKGHKFVPVTESFNAFKAAPADGASVTFKCSDCNETITLIAKAGKPVTSEKGCSITTTTKYEFKTAAGADYTYQVEQGIKVNNAIVKKTLTFKYAYDNAVTVGDHLVGKINNQTIRLKANAEVEFNANYEEFLKSNVIRWNEGQPAACNVKNFAVFTCGVCGEVIVIKLSGKHDLTGAVTPATCTTAEKTACVDCGTLVETASALGHDYGEWVIKGETVIATDANGALVVTHVGYAESQCSRCSATLSTVDNQKYTTTNHKGYQLTGEVKPTCGADGKVVVEFWYGDGVTADKKVASTTITLPKLSSHKTAIADAKKWVKYYDGANFNLAYYCEGCRQFIVVKSGTQTEVNDYIKNELKLPTNVIESK